MQTPNLNTAKPVDHGLNSVSNQYKLNRLSSLLLFCSGLPDFALFQTGELAEHSPEVRLAPLATAGLGSPSEGLPDPRGQEKDAGEGSDTFSRQIDLEDVCL